MEEYTFSAEDIAEFRELAGRFSRQTIQPYLNSEFSDGDMSKIDGIISAGKQAGLWADRENSLGIWGTDHSHAALSLEMLSALASSCAGVAVLFHSNGLAQRIFYDGGGSSGLPLLCALQESERPPAARLFLSHNTTLKDEDPKGVLTRYFVPVPEKSGALITFTRRNGRIALVLFELNKSVLQEERVRERLGLRACPLSHFHIAANATGLTLSEEATDLLRKGWYMHWLGLSAIAVGIARGALKAAREYCRQRYQGGTVIRDHDAIQTLLVNAQTALYTAESMLQHNRTLSDISPAHLTQAAMTKLSVMELCASAVTDSLQTFGGYGYMEDFGMEKRLRDMNTLRTMSGSPLYLRRLIFELSEEL